MNRFKINRVIPIYLYKKIFSCKFATETCVEYSILEEMMMNYDHLMATYLNKLLGSTINLFSVFLSIVVEWIIWFWNTVCIIKDLFYHSVYVPAFSSIYPNDILWSFFEHSGSLIWYFLDLTVIHRDIFKMDSSGSGHEQAIDILFTYLLSKSVLSILVL